MTANRQKMMSVRDASIKILQDADAPLQGLIITTRDFSPFAHREAKRADAVPVGFMRGEQLALLLSEHEVDVIRRSHEIIDLAARNAGPSQEIGANGLEQ